MKAKAISFFILVALGKTLSAQNAADIVTYINAYKEIAMAEMQRSGVPASIILAQGIHETEAGTSELVRKSNNHFGIKCKDSWTGSVVYHDDDERGECFRSYDNPRDSYRDHSDFLKVSPRYASLFRLDPSDYQGWAYGLKKAGYATNIHYPQILIRLIDDYNLQQYTLIALGKMDRQDEKSTESSDPLARTPVSARMAPNNEKKVQVNIIASPQYPAGEFTVNKTKVIFAKAGSSLLSMANTYDMPLSRLLDFNDLHDQDVLAKDQLLYLQRKRKTGNAEFHTVQEGETLYDISQSEGIRYQSLQELNLLSNGAEAAPGEILYLQYTAPARPALASERRQRPPAQYVANNSFNAAATAAPVTHIVEPKETLYSISKKYGVDADKIREWNKLDAIDLKIGQELLIYKN